MKRTFVQLLILICAVQQAGAQINDSLRTMNNNVNSHSTENFSSKLSSYIRVVADHVTSDKSGYGLNISLLAFKDSAKWMTDNDYLKAGNRFLRKTNFNAGVELDKNQSVNGINAGFTFALLDRRDSSVYVYVDPTIPTRMTTSISKAGQNYIQAMVQQGRTVEEATAIEQKAFLTLNNFNKSLDDKDIDSTFKTYLDKEIASRFPDATIGEAFLAWQHAFDQYAKRVQRRPLWTLYPTASYNYPGRGFQKVGVGSTFLVSLGKNIKRKPWELDIEGSYYKEDDTSTANKVDLNQGTLTFSVGVNKVLLENQQGESQMELKFDGKYQHFYGISLPQTQPSLELTFRYLVTKNMWLPLTVSYDPKNGKVLGFLSVAVNLKK